MPSSTPALDIPYALDVDARAAWPGTSKALAERVEAVLQAQANTDAAAQQALSDRAAALEGRTDLSNVFVGWTWGTGWEMSDPYAVAMGHLVFIAGRAKRTGAAISPGTAGDIPNQTVVTLDLGGRVPVVPTGITSCGGRRGVFFRTQSDSGLVSIQMVAVTGQADVDTNDVAEFSGVFLSTVPG